MGSTAGGQPSLAQSSYPDNHSDEPYPLDGSPPLLPARPLSPRLPISPSALHPPGGGGMDGTPPPSEAPPPSDRELRLQGALRYMDQIKEQFGDQSDTYNDFLDTMKDFAAQTIDTRVVVLRIASLFRRYPHLVLGFNAFLPPEYHIRPAPIEALA